ncbi:glycosyltransferase family 4 protein [Pseudalkalibacillus sp. A8]|uniref:glycosyltransferase family 4 protein n=1 Tax=Pseudalkalibacillus sp. A8 TaxID=3382641 RepID=UPI0038B426B0
MNIALFSDTYHPQINGVANTLQQLVNYWEKTGVQCKVIAPMMDPDNLFSLNTHLLPSMRFLLYKEYRVAIPYNRKITQELLAFQPDLIHVATPFSTGLYGLNFGRKHDITMVASYHTNFDHYLSYYHLQWATDWWWKYLSWFHRYFEKTYVPSQETLHHLSSKGFERLGIWGRGVDTSIYHPYHNTSSFRVKYKIPHDKIVLSYIGRLAPEKDIQTLIEIIRKFPQKWQDKVCWLIVGEGPSEVDLKSALKTFHNVLFTGYLRSKELSMAYSISDLFIFPSPTETFGNVVLESMACATPVIGTDSGGIRNIVIDGHNGYLVKPYEPQAFIDRIIFFLTHPNLSAQISTNARAYAKSQSWEVISSKLTSEYTELIESKQKIHPAS